MNKSDIHHGLSTRAKVILVLHDVQKGKSLSALLGQLLQGCHDKAFAHELTLGVLRHWHALQRIGQSLSHNPITDTYTLAGLHCGLYQLLYLSTPDHASIYQSVEALKEVGQTRTTGLVNAILRQVAKNPTKYRKKCDKNHSLPNHLAKRLKQDWGDGYDSLWQALRQAAPMFVRPHTVSFETYQQKLQDKKLSFVPMTLTGTAPSPYQLSAFDVSGVAVAELPDFDKGMATVQDIHAQLAVPIIQSALVNYDKKTPLNLLDACTAPAGKLAHWLSALGDTAYQMTAIDSDDMRLQRAFENLQRLGFDGLLGNKLTVKVADATVFTSDEPFDVVMLDAPCSATGVIRRHPDITLLRSEQDINQVVALQRQILDNLWQTVAQGGFLLYITCSILKAENAEQIAQFLDRHSNAKEIPLQGDWGILQTVGRQCLPMPQGGDGFYYALLQKH